MSSAVPYVSYQVGSVALTSWMFVNVNVNDDGPVSS